MSQPVNFASGAVTSVPSSKVPVADMVTGVAVVVAVPGVAVRVSFSSGV